MTNSTPTLTDTSKLASFMLTQYDQAHLAHPLNGGRLFSAFHCDAEGLIVRFDGPISGSTFKTDETVSAATEFGAFREWLDSGMPPVDLDETPGAENAADVAANAAANPLVAGTLTVEVYKDRWTFVTRDAAGVVTRTVDCGGGLTPEANIEMVNFVIN